MPMNWGPEAIAKLCGVLITTHEIRVDCNKLAAGMGEECTPKAVSHVIAKLKNQGKSAATKAPSTPSSGVKRARAPATPKSASKATPKSCGKANGKKAISNAESDDDESEDEDDQLPKDFSDDEGAAVVSTPSKDRSATRRSVSALPGRFAGVDDDSEEEQPVAKKVKAEPRADTPEQV